MPDTYDGVIAEQPGALAELLTRRAVATAELAAIAPGTLRKAYFVGSGTSRYAGEIAAAVWTDLLELDVECVATLRFLNDVAERRLGPDTVVVAISQSGGTLALVEGVQRARRLGSPTIAVTADPASALARAAEACVHSLTGEEAVFAKTKGFVTTALAACLAGRALAEAASASAGVPRPPSGALAPDPFERTLELLASRAAAILARSLEAAPALAARFTHVDGIAVVGSGTLLPAAREGALKILEVAKILVAPFELEESLHGPFNAFGPRTGLVLLAGAIPQADKLAAFRRAAEEIGAPLVTIGDAAPADLQLPTLPYPLLAPILGVLPLQVLASRLASLRGVNPNATRYPNLYSVFRTKAGHGEEVR